MKKLKNLTLGIAGACLLAVMALSATSASAMIVSADLYNDPFGLTGLRGTISSDGDGFEVLVANDPAVIWDATAPGIGGIFTNHPPNEANETAFANANRNGGPEVAFTTKTDLDDIPGADGENFDFMSTAEYILLKIGGGNTLNTALIHNLSGGILNLNFSTDAQGSGLSHYTEFSQTSVVPLPAALPLLLTAIAGFGFVGRCKKKMARA